MVRVFGKAGDAVVDRAAETRIFASLHPFGPRLLGVFGNGRLEEWLDGRRPLTPEEMLQPAIVGMVARKLAEMHVLRPAGAGAPEASPWSGEAFWGTLRGWQDKVEALRFPAGSAGAGATWYFLHARSPANLALARRRAGEDACGSANSMSPNMQVVCGVSCMKTTPVPADSSRMARASACIFAVDLNTELCKALVASSLCGSRER